MLKVRVLRFECPDINLQSAEFLRETESGGLPGGNRDRHKKEDSQPGQEPVPSANCQLAVAHAKDSKLCAARTRVIDHLALRRGDGTARLDPAICMAPAGAQGKSGRTDAVAGPFPEKVLDYTILA